MFPDGGNSKITGIGEKHGFSFALDVGSIFYLDSVLGEEDQTFLTSKTDIVITPPHQHAVGMLAEEKESVFSFDAGSLNLETLEWNIKVDIDYLAGATKEFRYINLNIGKKGPKHLSERRDIISSHNINVPLEILTLIRENAFSRMSASWHTFQATLTPTAFLNALGSKRNRNASACHGS